MTQITAFIQVEFPSIIQCENFRQISQQRRQRCQNSQVDLTRILKWTLVWNPCRIPVNHYIWNFLSNQQRTTSQFTSRFDENYKVNFGLKSMQNSRQLFCLKISVKSAKNNVNNITNSKVILMRIFKSTFAWNPCRIPVIIPYEIFRQTTSNMSQSWFDDNFQVNFGLNSMRNSPFPSITKVYVCIFQKSNL